VRGGRGGGVRDRGGGTRLGGVNEFRAIEDPRGVIPTAYPCHTLLG